MGPSKARLLFSPQAAWGAGQWGLQGRPPPAPSLHSIFSGRRGGGAGGSLLASRGTTAFAWGTQQPALSPGTPSQALGSHPCPCGPSACLPCYEQPDENSAEALGLGMWAAADKLMSVTQFVRCRQWCASTPQNSPVKRPPPPSHTRCCLSQRPLLSRWALLGFPGFHSDSPNFR